MIREANEKQLTVAEFDWPFLSELNEDNRWVKLADASAWETLSGPCLESFANSTLGRPAKPARLVIGAVIIKHKLVLSDCKTVDQISENPYLQYFVGLSGFQAQKPFAPSLLVWIRCPIVRGKQHKSTEFGAKINVSLDADGLARIDCHSWNAFHEGNDLPEQVESFHERYGHYPEVVMADNIHGTRSNRAYLKDNVYQ
jgi:hypothetical protein